MTSQITACELNEIAQYLLVQELRNLSEPWCEVYADAMDEDAYEDCAHDSEHGIGPVFIGGDFLCRSCGLDVAQARMEPDGYVDVEVYR